MSRTRLFAAVAAGGLLAAFFAQGLAFIRANSQTSDEAAHLNAGYSYLTTRDFRLNQEHPPLIKELSALPILLRYHLPYRPDTAIWAQAVTQPHSTAEWVLGLRFLYGSPVPAADLLTLGRLPNLILGTLVVALIGWWSFRLWGTWAALTAAALAAFEPNLVAHTSLITTDLGATAFMFLAVYLLWEYVRRPSWWTLAGTGVATGLALVSKYSAVLLIGILALLAVGVVVAGGRLPLPTSRAAHEPRHGGLWMRVRDATLPVTLMLVFAFALIPIVYGFHEVGTWWTGLEDVLLHQHEGHDAFLLGQHSQTGWWYYFSVAFAIKTPIELLILIAASLLLVRAGERLRRTDALFLLLPVAVVFIAMMLAHVDIGIRHLLPVYPFLLVVASRVATFAVRPAAARVALVGVPVLLTVGSSLRTAPHQLAYFNELVGGPNNGYRYLSDSNIDWGQDLGGLTAYVQERHVPIIYLSYFGNAPHAAYGFRFQEVPSYGSLESPSTDIVPPDVSPQLFAISVMNIDGTQFDDHAVYRWVLSRTPVARIGYSIYVYDITHDADAHVELAKTYLEYGPQSLARPELLRARAIDPANAEARRMLAALPPGSA